MEKFKFLKKEEVEKLPKKPGVYCFKKKKILYIGKAANIKERVKNHFLKPGFKESIFLDEAKKIGYIKTDSEIEALILEANLIKKYQPKYNVVWKDDKNYFFVGITKEDFPRIFITHQTKKLYPKPYTLNPKYVGPFVDGTALKQTLKTLRKVFPFRSCRVLPKRACLWYHLRRCSAPCLLKSKFLIGIPKMAKELKKESQRNANLIFEIIRGRKLQVLKELKKEMREVAKTQDFEKAAKIRDQILALEKVLAHARIFESQAERTDWLKIQKILQEILKTKRAISKIEAYDISNIQGKLATGSMVIFIDGKPEKNFYRKFKIKISKKPNDILMIKEVLSRRFKHPEWPFPELILIDGGIAQLNAALKVKNEKLKTKNIKVLALAKKRNELFIEGQKEPILLKSLPREIFNLILQLRDEAHRFAISYHKKLREIDTFG